MAQQSNQAAIGVFIPAKKPDVKLAVAGESLFFVLAEQQPQSLTRPPSASSLHVFLYACLRSIKIVERL